MNAIREIKVAYALYHKGVQASGEDHMFARAKKSPKRRHPEGWISAACTKGKHFDCDCLECACGCGHGVK